MSSIIRSHAQPILSLTISSQIVIVGAGTFGLSTAFHLLGRGYTHVTVLDRARELPAVDAAGTDINKGACRHRLRTVACSKEQGANNILK